MKSLKSDRQRQNAFTLAEGVTHVAMPNRQRKDAFTLAEGVTHVAMPNGQRQNAFTLAEVLITLGIIGIVAAMTLPTLIQNKQKKELEIGLHKAYSQLNQALVKMYNETGETINHEAFPWTGTPPYFKFKCEYIKYFDSPVDCVYRCVNREDDNEYKTTIYRNYAKNNSIDGHYLDDGQFILKDGMTVMIENVERLWITVDVNGYKKKPNIWGQDLFTFQITNDGKLLPMGAEGTDYVDVYCSKTSNSTLNGIGCTYKALTDKNYWKNLP